MSVIHIVVLLVAAIALTCAQDTTMVSQTVVTDIGATIVGPMTTDIMTTNNMTTGNMTTGNMTTANMTTGNMTTGNMTTANMTTSNMTTSNMTTTSFTTAMPTSPTPCPVVRWVVLNSNSEVCMRMDFNGSIAYLHGEDESLTVQIPETTNVDNSECSDTMADFRLNFTQANYGWQLLLSFTIDGDNYHLSSIGVYLTQLNGTAVHSNLVEDQFVTVPVGQYYTCDEYVVGLDEFDIELRSPIFQPFAQETEDRCGLGTAYECGSEGSSGSNTGLIVGCVIGGVVGLAAALGLTYFIINERKKKNYTNIE